MGEGITGLVGIGVRDRHPTTAAALIAIAIGALLLVSALSLATRQVFSVALYRYASGAPGADGFAAADLEDPFRRRGHRG